MSITNPANALPREIRDEMKETFGIVPSFAHIQQPEQLKLWWTAVRDFQMSDQTALDNKTKELIGLGVAAQIPCTYCALFHTEAARLNGASEQELQEAIFMAGLTRQGSTLLNGAQLDTKTFEKEMRQIVEHLKGNARAPRTKPVYTMGTDDRR